MRKYKEEMGEIYICCNEYIIEKYNFYTRLKYLLKNSKETKNRSKKSKKSSQQVIVIFESIFIIKCFGALIK